MTVRRISFCTLVLAAFVMSATAAMAGDKPAEKGAKEPPPPAANIQDVDVKGAWIRAARKGENAYIFLTVKNGGEIPVRLSGGYVDKIAKRVRIVQFKSHGPMLRPVMVGPVPVEGHETFAFEPGVAALELQELTRDLNKGDTLPITVAFARAGEIEIEAEIDSRTAVRYPEPEEDSHGDKKDGH